MGFWANNVCGNTYFFSNKLVGHDFSEYFYHCHVQGTWEQNVERCCSLGLSPIALETKEELECLEKFIGSILLTVLLSYFYHVVQRQLELQSELLDRRNAEGMQGTVGLVLGNSGSSFSR
jgi:hypothetical protein